MKIRVKSGLGIGAAILSLAACEAPQLVTLQPIGAPEPTNAQQTFVDADGCSWWIIGNAADLSWAPMTNSNGEHVCDGGATRLSPPVGGQQDLTGLEAPAGVPIDQMPIAQPAPRPAAPSGTGDDDLLTDLEAALSRTPDDATFVTPTTNTAPPPPSNAAGPYFVQVASFAKEENVQASERLFESLGYAVSSGSGARGEDNLYRLVLGPFADRAAAQEAVEQAFNEGFDDAFPYRP